MIDWKKEVATKNYCGWCDGTPTGGSCGGDCFKDVKNRVDHTLEMLTRIPEEIEALKKREQDFKDALSA